MKVKQLIELLEKEDGDRNIYIDNKTYPGTVDTNIWLEDFPSIPSIAIYKPTLLLQCESNFNGFLGLKFIGRSTINFDGDIKMDPFWRKYNENDIFTIFGPTKRGLYKVRDKNGEEGLLKKSNINYFKK